MKELKFSIRHDGCWTDGLNREFPGSMITIVHTYGVSKTIIEVSNISSKGSEEVVNHLSNHEALSEVVRTHYSNEAGTAYYVLEGNEEFSNDFVWDVLVRNACFPHLPPTVENGREHWTVLVSNDQMIGKAHDELQKVGNIDVERLIEPNAQGIISGLNKLKDGIHELSDRQLEVLSLAIQNGYYDSPRACTLEELAELDKANMSTVGEHLRRAESKIFTQLGNVLNN